MIKQSFNDCRLDFLNFVLIITTCCLALGNVTISTTFGATSSCAHRATISMSDMSLSEVEDTDRSRASFLHLL
jgi:hypothetical protein